MQEAIRCAGTPREALEMTQQKFTQQQRLEWDKNKEEVMQRALLNKFKQYPSLKAMLLGTGSRKIVEHTRHDKYWGDGGDGTGKNRLGNLLMDLRFILSEEKGPL